MERFFELAGTCIRVTGADSEMFCDPGILTPFEVTSGDWRWNMEATIVDTLPEPEGVLICDTSFRRVYRAGDREITYTGGLANSLAGANVRSERRGREIHVQVKRDYLVDRIGPKVVLAALDAEHIVVEEDGFLLHCSCVRHQDRAILFTAPSGIGKSTQASLWEQHRGAEIINGDRIAVRRCKNGFEALGVPFSGSSGICKNQRLPIAAIVYLAQARETTIQSLTGLKAFRSLWEGCSVHTWNKTDVSRCLTTVTEAAARIPVYHLACTPDESAVKAVETVLRK